MSQALPGRPQRELSDREAGLPDDWIVPQEGAAPAPAFDPTQPYEIVRPAAAAAGPAFDPRQPYEIIRTGAPGAQRELSDADVGLDDWIVPDGPAAQQQPQPQPQQTLGRALGLTARIGVEGGASLLDWLNNAGAAVANAPAAVVNDVAGRQVVPEPFRYNVIGDAARGFADRLGLPRRETPLERIVGAAGDAAVGAATGAGVARALPALPGIAGQIVEAFRAAPGVDAVGGAVGGAAQGAVQEAGGGEAAGFAANLGGNAAGAVLASVILATVARRRGVPASTIRPESITPEELAAVEPEVLSAYRAQGFSDAEIRQTLDAFRLADLQRSRATPSAADVQPGATTASQAPTPRLAQDFAERSRPPTIEPVDPGVPVAAAGQRADDALGLPRQTFRAEPDASAFGQSGGALVPVEPQPARMTPGEIARARAANEGGNPNTAEPPPRFVAPEGRLPQTPDQVQEQRQAGQAFAGAERQRERVGPEVRDTQPAGRPEGVDAQTVTVDQGFPVRVISRDGRGFAQVQRFDPRTGEVEPGSVRYVVREADLRQGRYAVDPRQAQDVAERMRGPRPPEQARMPGEPVAREPRQTYRATAADPNEDFPGATRPGPEGGMPPPGRSPFPEQPQGPGSYRRWSSAEEAERAFQQRRAEAEAEARRARDSGEWNAGQRSTNRPAAQDADGRWQVQGGYVVSDAGGPIRFGDQRQAARWIIAEGQARSPDQFFEIAVHPSGQGFTVRERGRNAGPRQGGAASPEQAGPAAPEPPRMLESPGRSGDGAAPREPRLRGADTTPAPVVPDAPAPRAYDPQAALPTTPREATAFIRRAVETRDAPALQSLLRDVERAPEQARMAQAIRQALDYLRSQERGAAPLPADRAPPMPPPMPPPAAAAPEAPPPRPRTAPRRPEVQPDPAQERALETRIRALQAERDTLSPDAYAPGGNAAPGPRRAEVARELAAAERQLERLRQARTPGAAEAQARAVQQMADAAQRLDATPSFRERVAAGFDAWRARWEAQQGRKLSPVADSQRHFEAGVRFATDPAIQARYQARLNENEAKIMRRSGATYSDPNGRQRAIEATRREFRPADYDQTAAKRAWDAGEMWGADNLDALRAPDPIPEQVTTTTARGRETRYALTDATEARATAENLRSLPASTFYANPVGDPEAWRRFVAEPLRSAFGGTLQTAGRAVQTLRDYGNAVVASSDGQQRAIAARYPNAPTFGRVLDMLHAPAGEARGIARTFSEAVSVRTNQRVAEIERLVGAMKRDGVAPEAVVRAVTLPGVAADAKVRPHAEAVRRLLREELDYMRGAGVQVGDRGRAYFPRDFDMAAVSADERGFMARATAEYMRGNGPGLSRVEAEKAAARLLVEIKLGGFPGIAGEPGGFGIGSFTRERIFAAGAEGPDRLGRYYAQQDMESALVSYVQRATKRAEIARRFGDRFQGWAEIRKALADEGVNGDDIASLQTHVEAATGVLHSGLSRGAQDALGVARTLATMGQLDQSVIINLSELLMAGVRTGRLDDSLLALGRGLRQWGREIAGLKRDAAAELAESLGVIGGHGHNAIMAARFAAGDPTGRWQEKQLAAFFKRIGLEQLTNATRVASAQSGRVFLDRLAAGVMGESALTSPQRARFFLRELGVPDDQAPAFARFVRGAAADDLPAAMERGGAMADLYQTALARFVDQTVMRPDAATRPRWAAHPVGAAVFTLNSYAYAFTKNVLLRSLRLAKEGATGTGYTPVDRVAFMAPLMLTLPVFAAGQIALQQLRAAAMGDPEREARKTDTARAEDMVKQSGLLGGAQMWLDIASSAAFGRETASAASGPVFGLGLGFVDAVGRWALQNSPRTTTAERNLAREGYRTIVEPGVNAALGMLPGGGVLGGAARTAATYAAGARPTQDAFVDAVGGPSDPATLRRQRRTPIKGVTERLGGLP